MPSGKSTGQLVSFGSVYRSMALYKPNSVDTTDILLIRTTLRDRSHYKRWIRSNKTVSLELKFGIQINNYQSERYYTRMTDLIDTFRILYWIGRNNIWSVSFCYRLMKDLVYSKEFVFHFGKIPKKYDLKSFPFGILKFFFALGDLRKKLLNRIRKAVYSGPD